VRVPQKAWENYIGRMGRLSKAATKEMRMYVNQRGLRNADDLIYYAYNVATRYGEGAAVLAAQMYDAIAELEGALVPPAEMAETASYDEVARTMNGILKTTENEEIVSSAVGRMVKQAGADTTLKNAIRDGAEFAWVPHGDTCAFCVMLASNGWKRASKKALKNGHAEHIHSNCDCEYAVRFDSSTTVAGYDPDRYLKMYEDAEGSRWQDKVNSMRRDFYAENSEEINAQKRSAYAKRRERESSAAEELDV